MAKRTRVEGQATGPWWKALTRYQWLVLIVAWLGWVFDIMDTALFNIAKRPMLVDMLGSEEAYKLHGPVIEGQIQMVFLIGWSIGGLVFGVLADRWGRTRTLIITILMYCALTGLTALCQTPEQVAVARFLTALGIGGEWAAGVALVAEALPDRARAPAAAFIQSAAAVGPALAATIGIALAAAPWQWLFLVGVIPAALTVVIRRHVKEPERWERSTSKAPAQPLKELFGTGVWRRHAVVAAVIGVVGIAGAGNVSFWLPNLVASVSEGAASELIQQRTGYAMYVLQIGTLLGVMVVPWLCERWGRKRTLAVCFVAAPISVAVASLGATTYASLLWLAPLMSFFSIGLSAAFVLYFPELFPTRIRATGSGFAYNTGRIASAPVPYLTGLLIGGAKGGVGEGMARAGLVYLLGLIALLFAPETKGKPLPES